MIKRACTTKSCSTLTSKENNMLNFIKEWEERHKEKEDNDHTKHSKNTKSN